MRIRSAVVMLAWAGVLVLAGCPDSSAPTPAPTTTERRPGGPGTPDGTPDDAPAPPNPDADRRIGDAGLTPVGAYNAEHYPQYERWRAAGVTGGIPDRMVTVTVAVGEDVGAAVAGAAGGVVELAAGEHTLAARLTLPAGTVLRGAVGGATLRYGGGGDPVAIEVEGADGVGIENLTLVYADPDALAGGEHLRDRFYASVPGFEPGPDAAIQFQDVSDCWVSDVTVQQALSHPLALRRCRNMTLRGVKLHGVLNRGAGAGSLVVEGCEGVVFGGLSVRGLRLIHLRGPAQGLVFKGVVTGAAFYLDEADLITGCLFEDCHLLFRPGHLFMPFAKDRMPLGPDNVVFSAMAYHHGTDAMSGNVLEEGRVYQLNRYAGRPNEGWFVDREEKGFLTPYRYKRVLPMSDSGVPTVEPALAEAPEGVKVRRLPNRAKIGDWTAAVVPGAVVGELGVADLVDGPLVPGASRRIGPVEVAVSEIEAPAGARVLDSFPTPFDANRNLGQFGWSVVVPSGAPVDLLALNGGDWTGGGVLQRVFEVQSDAYLNLTRREVGCNVRLFVGEMEIKPGEMFRLKPGLHVMTALAVLEKKMSLITSASLEVSVDLQEPPTPTIRGLEVAVPEHGSLYPFRPGVDELAAERAALAAWPVFYRRVLWKCPLPDVTERVAAYAADHAGTHGAWVAEGIATVLDEAPYREADVDSLSPLQWGELMDYYTRRGIPERKWVGGKAKPGAGEFEAFYPRWIKD